MNRIQKNIPFARSQLRLSIAMGSLAITTIVGAPAVIAQGATEAGARPPSIEEIVVTANKRIQNITDVGLSITAATGESLVDRGITAATDLGKIVPGLTVQPSPFNTPVYTLRGVGFYETTLSAAPTVAVYVDEIQLPFSATTKGATFDIDRVEVLKGPQGTLFGQNTTGGAINYIASKPTDEFASGVTGSYGRFGRLDTQGFVSGPITDTLKGRMALNTVQGGAWQKSYTRDDKQGDQDQLQGRLILEWSPSEELNATLTASAWRDNSETQAAQLIDDTCGPAVPGDLSSCGSPDAQNFRVYPRSPSNARAADWGYGVFGRNNERNDDFYQVSLRVDYDMTDTLQLTSISAYSDYDTDSVQDFDGSTYATVDTNTTGYIKDFSQELRLAAQFDRGNAIVGVNYNKTKTYDSLFYNFSEGPSSNPLWFIPGAPRGDLTYNYSDQDIETAAIFGNVEFNITDQMVLLGGARYTDSKRDFAGCTNDWPGPSTTADWWNAIFGTSVQDGGCITFDETFTVFNPADVDKLDEDNVSWNVGLNYKLVDDTLIYGRVSKGYKAGSFPTASVASYTGYLPVKQESVLAYELGAKSSLADGRVNVSAAIFLYDYADKQLRGRKPDPVFGTLDGLVQIPKGEVTGAEFDIAVTPVDNLRLSLGGTYIDTKVKEFEGFNALGQLLDFKGQDFPFSPKLTLIGDAEYNFPISPSMNGFVGVSLTHNSSTSAQLDNKTTQYVTADDRFDIDAYSIWDVRAGIELPANNLQLTAYVYNAGDEYYWTNVQNNLASISQFTGMPRTYGIRVRWQY